MKETLTIENFVGINRLVIDLKKINILIGPQATGKSVVAKLLFYFKGFIWELFSAVENEQTKRELDSRFIKKFEKYFPPDSWGKGKFNIKYTIKSDSDDVFIEVRRHEETASKIDLEYSEYFKKKLDYCRRLLKKSSMEKLDKGSPEHFGVLSSVRKDLINNITNELGATGAFLQLFIPAGRSFFANLQGSVFTYLSSDNVMDPFLEEFGSLYESVKRFPRLAGSRKNKLKTKLDSLVESILCGRHLYEKGKDYIITDGRKINVANSSSGQQEILPLAIILRTLPLTWFIASGGKTVYIEEPEAHMFPTAQRHIIELIASVFNYPTDPPFPLQFVITTHSPYILTAINNLMHAGGLRTRLKESDLSTLEKIVPPERMLNPEDVAVYSLSEGRCETIISQETGLIQTNVIDSVSDELAIQFDKLLDIEY